MHACGRPPAILYSPRSRAAGRQVPANQTSDPSGDGQYYIGLAGGFPFDARTCSVFSNSSALLDYGTTHGFATGGHPRFSHLGWVLGGEFAMYYFGATVINEVADNLFVVPADTVRWGWKTKLLSIVLEVFQLGALCAGPPTPLH